MRKLNYFIFLFLPVLFIFLPTQDSTAQSKEFGLRMSNLREFGMVYKKKKVDYWTRWQASFGNLEASFGGTFTGGLGIGLQVGREKRKEVGEKLNFIHGPQFLLGLNMRTSTDSFNGSVSTGFGYLVGMTALLKNNFSVSLETVPRLTAMLSGNGDFTNLDINAGFNSEFAALVFTKGF